MFMKRVLRIGLISGDGIGREVVPHCTALLDQFSAHFDFKYEFLDAGFEHFKKHGTALPDKTVQRLKECDAAVFGAVSSPSGKVAGYRSPIVQLRKKFNLFGNVRPSISLPIDIPGNVKNVNMIVVRENTECLYTGEENEYIKVDHGSDTFNADDSSAYTYATCLRTISEPACRNIARLAGRIALRSYTDPVVTIAHKANVMPLTDGLFLNVCRKTLHDLYDNIVVKDQLVDSLAMKMVQDPTQFKVIVAPNFHGDILSDIASGLTGGLGLSAGLNIGYGNFVIGEPVHGSAPDIEGKGIANPIATFRSVGMMLDHLTDNPRSYYSSVIDNAIRDVILREHNSLTPDLFGKGTTQSTVDAVLNSMNRNVCKM